MALRDDAILIGAAGIGAYLLYSRLRAAIPSASQIVASYTGGIVRNTDGTINVPATIGVTNPSGIPPKTQDQVIAARVAVALDLPIYYLRAGGFGTPEWDQDGEIDAQTTIAHVAEVVGAPIIRGFFGGVKVADTAESINQTLQGAF
jgi:hypothetical protein